MASACNGKLQTFPQWLRDNVKGAPKSRRPGAVSGRPITPNVVKLLVEHDTDVKSPNNMSDATDTGLVYNVGIVDA
jgi:hypothetical protein